MSLQTVAIKVDLETAHKLALLPNRSEFIRKALAAALRPRCPLCAGTGKLPSWHPLGAAFSNDLHTTEARPKPGMG